MLIRINFDSETPIYIQLKEQIIEGIAQGELEENESLPSVRQLAEDIGINLHTVNKAYNILKSEGYVSIDRRKGAMINKIPHTYNEDINKQLKENLKGTLAEMHCKGITKEQVDMWTTEIFEAFIKEGGM